MRFELLIGLRYLRARRQEKFISLITLISTIGVILGVMTLNVVLAVMSGFEDDLRERILGFNPQIIISAKDAALTGADELVERVRKLEGVVAAAPFATGQVMLSSQGNVTGSQVRGVGPSALEVLDLDRRLKEGKFEDLAKLHDVPPEDGSGARVQLPGLIIGRDISRHLGLLVGDPVTVISPLATPSAVGLVPRVRRFVIVGLFESGMSEYDAALAYMNLPDAQRFFDLKDAASGIEVRVADAFGARPVRDRIRAALGDGYEVLDWMDANRSLFSALAMEKYVYATVLLLIVLVAAFNIVAMLIMVVMEKRKDIAVLKSMGATGRSVGRIFRWKGMIIGLLGTAVGDLIALVLCTLMQRYQIVPLPADVFYVNTLPVSMRFDYFAMVTAASLLIAFLATIYPARHAASLTPVEVIRYE